MPLKEMVLEMVKASIAVSLFISLVIGADSVSGERERATLEGLLLTPASRRQIIVGKFLAAVSPWPVALAIAVPYWNAVSQGDEVFGRAALWGSVLGSLLAPALAGLGMLVSIWCNTNKASMVLSLGLYLLLLLPTRPSGPVQPAYALRMAAYAVEWANPLAATSRFLAQVLVKGWSGAEVWFWLTMPVLFSVLVPLVLFMFASPVVRLEAETASRFRPYWARVVALWNRAVPVTAKSSPS
jgi:ABC-2 type transport system permease protein